MPQGRPTSLKIALTPEERQTLRAWQWATTLPAGRARRGRILLLLDQGRTITRVAALVGVSRRNVYTWARRFLAQGLHGLRDLPRPSPAHRRRRVAAGKAQP